MKTILSYLFVFYSVFCTAQTSQNYDRDWGTYFGGINPGGVLGGIKYKFTATNNGPVILDAEYNSSTNTAYYNQFITPGMQGFISGSPNRLEANIAEDGNVLSSKYALLNTMAGYESIIYREADGTYYKREAQNIQNAVATSGVWLTNYVAEDVVNNFTSLIAKYTASGTLLWRTFVPYSVGDLSFTTDSDGNLYFSGSTNNQNLADATSFQPDFVLDYSNGNLRKNAYLVKLNASGQKVWATYYPAEEIYSIDEYNGGLFLVTNSDFLPTNSNLATGGTFQQNKAISALARFDTSTGQRVWGTYYGTTDTYGGIASLKVTETGIYTMGLSFEIYSPNNTNYFGTSGAYQTSPSGDQDIVLSKFDFTGNRTWSTYFGGVGSDEFSSLDVKGDKILFAGNTMSQNLATPNSFLNVKPNPASTVDIMFAMFNINGGLVFSSYYGGTDPTLSSFLAGSVTSFFSKNSDSFYLGGITANRYGFTTEGAWQPSIVPISGQNNSNVTPFIAKFSTKSLSTSENELSENIQLFDNPNNGNFTLSGSVLEKEICSMKIYDLAGRVIFQKALNKSTTQKFNLGNVLISGNYLVEVSGDEKQKLKVFKMMVK